MSTNPPAGPNDPFNPQPNNDAAAAGSTPTNAQTPSFNQPPAYGQAPQQPQYGQVPPQDPPSGQQPYGFAPTPPLNNKANWMGITALVLGILALLGSWMPIANIFSILLAIVGVVFGVMGFLAVKKGTANNKTMSIIGTVLSVLAIITAILVNVMVGIAATSLKKEVEKNPGAFASALSGTGYEATNKGKRGEALSTAGFLGKGKAEITLKEIKDPSKAESDMPAGADERFVSAHFTIKSTGTEKFESSLLMATKVINSNGQSYPSAFYKPADGKALEQKVELNAGATVEGWVLYKLPKDEKVGAIQFGDAEWAVN